METRANYVLIGVSALLAIVLGLAFFVWLASFQLDRQYSYYDVYFDNVSGLSRASEVRFSGLAVGQVVSLDLASDGSGRVRVRVQVDAGTPVHVGALAQLQAQGVTGLSLVAITPGDPAKPLLRATQKGVPVIPGQRSVVQSLTEDAPDLLNEAIKLVKEFQVIAVIVFVASPSAVWTDWAIRSSLPVKTEIWPVASATVFEIVEKSDSARSNSPEAFSTLPRIAATRSWFVGPTMT